MLLKSYKQTFIAKIIVGICQNFSEIWLMNPFTAWQQKVWRYLSLIIRLPLAFSSHRFSELQYFVWIEKKVNLYVLIIIIRVDSTVPD